MSAKMTLEELEAFFAREFPQVAPDLGLEAVGGMAAQVRLRIGPAHLRPGGTVSGPTMALLADVAFYAALLAMIGPVALSVTTNMNIAFLRKPQAGRDLIGETRILKLGRLLASGDVLIRSDGDDRPVAHAQLTYAIPQER